jgi:hypothetical protein
VIEVDVSQDILPRHHGVLHALHLLSVVVPTDTWCLVGGMMVVIAARAAGGSANRAGRTKDGDILVDVCANERALDRVVNQLIQVGYEPPRDTWHGRDIARCTLVSGYAQVDVLAPDDATSDQLDVESSKGTVSTIAIPGGRRALELSELVSVYYAEDAYDVVVRVPLLPAALVVKSAAAMDERTVLQERHIQDVALLLGVAEQPDPIVAALEHRDLVLLGSLRNRLMDDNDRAWDYHDTVERLRAQAMFDLLTS